MNLKLLATSTILLALFANLAASPTNKAPLDHSVYDGWKNLSRQQFSNNGEWISYEINPQQGDGWLYLYNLANNTTDSMARGSRAVFSPNSDFIAYFIEPAASAVRQAKADGKKREEMPQSSLGIRLLPGTESIVVENVQSFSVPGEDTSWIFYSLAKMPEDTLKGTALVAFNRLTRTEHRFPGVTDHTISDNGALLAFVQPDGEEENSLSLSVFKTATSELQTIFKGAGTIKTLSADDAGSKLAFVFGNNNDQEDADNDTDGSNDDHSDREARAYSLYLWQEGNDEALLIADTDTPGMPDRWQVSQHTSLLFAKNGNKLFFGTAPIPEPEPVDTLLPEEKHSVDVWHYRDPLIQPMQLVQLSREEKRNYQAVYHINNNRMVQLADEVMPDVSVSKKLSGTLILGESKLPYLIANSFESGDYRDVYLIDLHSGEKRMILEKHRGSVHLSRRGDARLSPGGHFIIFYNQADRQWHAISTENHSKVILTAGISYPVFDELHDAPSEPDPYGIAGWVENDSHVLIYDRFDIWKLDPSGKEEAVSLTNGYGRKNNIRLRYVQLNDEKEHIGHRESIFLEAFNIYNKQNGFYTVDMHRPRNPKRIIMEDANYFRPIKAANAEVLAWRKSTFDTYPDLWVSDMDFRNSRQVSYANPQQQGYLWGSVELVGWVSFANDSLQGLLYVPENLDPETKHPMIVYFYERMSDRLHSHFIPAPSRSTINISYMVSNGYIVFVPDIPYIIGYPGQSAYNAIVSGTKAMLNQFSFIDRQNVGIQGQSWAGYQIAWLITQTDIYKAAMAGAPVSNMISAYGGIRWSTGMSRIYQYEETQSRIGGTIWDQTLRYIENSPIFHANKVNTPLLMMHNDADGAVPWYQGIEYFMALRRLDKPVWMLNYNDEAHNLIRWPNRVDLSHRMYDFFDHYLKGAPAPRWMEEGVPAIRKNM